MLRNIVFIFLAYILLGGFIYMIFLYDRSPVKNITDIKFYTSDFYTLEGNNSIKKESNIGPGFKILEYVYKKRNLPQPKIELAPISVYFPFVLESRKYAITTLTKTFSMEYLFKWAGPIFSTYRHVYVLEKDYDKYNGNITNLDYAIVNGFFDESLLARNQVSEQKISLVDNYAQAIEQIKSGKAQAIVMGSTIKHELSTNPKYKDIKFKSIFNLGERHYYFAFNVDTPNNIIVKFQEDINEFKKTKEYIDYVNNLKN